MVMGWRDCFLYGMFHNYSVRNVYNRKPSYLVWTVCNTSTKFTPDVMSELKVWVLANPEGTENGLTKRLVKQFNLKFVPGPW